VCFDFLEKFYFHRQQYYACGTKHNTDYTWNQITAEALGTFPCKPKILETQLGKQL
jgi:hypothetical protein